MKKSELKQLIREEISKVLNEREGDYSEKVANAIANDAKGKTEKEKIALINRYLDNDKENNWSKVEKINWMMDEDFVSDVLNMLS